jgi:hypothetical protein
VEDKGMDKARVGFIEDKGPVIWSARHCCREPVCSPNGSCLGWKYPLRDIILSIGVCQ